MTVIEIVFSVIGIGIIIGGFVYAIYDSYCQSKDYRTSRKNKLHTSVCSLFLCHHTDTISDILTFHHFHVSASLIFQHLHATFLSLTLQHPVSYPRDRCNILRF